MDSYLAGSIVQAGASLGNAALQFAQNKTDKKFTREMYQRQLEDSRENWRMQNEYNSPLQQMARLEAAGLNPNLVYGQGAVANSSSQPGNVAPMSWHQNAPQIDGQSLNIMAQMLALKKMQLDNEGSALDNKSKALGVQKEEANAPYYEDNARLVNEQLSIAVDSAWSERNIKEAEAYLAQVNKAFVQYTTHLDMPYQDSEEKFNAWVKQVQDALGSAYGQEWLSKLQLTPYQLAKAKADISLVFKQMDKLGADILHLQKQNKYIDANIRKISAEAEYQEFKTEMIKNGVNIDDPIWARALAAFLEGLTGGKGILSWLSGSGSSVRSTYEPEVSAVESDLPIDKKVQMLVNLFVIRTITGKLFSKW